MLKIEETLKEFGHDPSKLSKGSNKSCLCSCDYCGDIVEKKYFKWLNSRKHVQKDSCNKKECRLQKQEANNLIKRGVKHHSQTQEYRDKFKKTCMERYGVDNPFKDIEKIKKRKIVKEKRNVSDVSRLKRSRKKTDNAKKNLRTYNIQDSKRVEKEVLKYFQSQCAQGATQSQKVQVEYCDLHTHSELFKEKKYHFKKFNRCKQQGVTLIQIFQDEWINNPAVCKSLIQNKLGACQNKLFARKLDVVDSDCLDEKRFSQFFEENHLQANTRFQQAFGLTNDAGDIVFAISLRRPFTKSKRGCVEIARVATRKDTVVVGGFSRLMKRVVAWAKDREFEKILTYSDCRYSQGDVYEKYGFSFCGHTGVGYDYTDFTQRLNRFKFRAQKPKTEKQVAEENGVSRIYNAGNYRWELTL